MSFEVRTGDRGPAALWDGKRLTSAYDAVREAKTWAEATTCAPGALVFVAGDPLGLASASLAERGFRAVALLPGADARPWVSPELDAWAPEDGPLEDFLSRIFETAGPEAVVWQVWPAFERHAADTALEWGRRFRDLYRTVQGSWLTQRRFGSRFWRNALRNFVDWRHPAQLVPGNRPLVIAASGPSLDDGLEVLARQRGRFDLWALPSSFETLVRLGLTPDAGVATDGGFYAREHLQRLAGTRVPLLAALASAPDPVLAHRPCLFFSQGLAVERALLQGLGTPYPEVPSQGTVAVTALRLALEATSGPVFIAGLDLAFRDLRGHTSPHTVDRRLAGLDHRLTPSEGLWAERRFEQATIVRQGTVTSQALWTYALWFQTRARFSRLVYRIAPSALHWHSMTEVSWQEAVEHWNAHPGRRSGSWSEVPGRGNRAQRRQQAYDALAALRDRVEASSPDDPWLIETARTAVPEALAEDFRDRRQGRPGASARAALGPFLAALQEELS